VWGREGRHELAKLVAEVEMGRTTTPTFGLTVEQLVERYIVDRSPGWSPGAGDETHRRVAQHITPHIAIERLRPSDVQQLHAGLRAGGLGEGTIGRVHDVLRAALNWAERLDLIVKYPAPKVDRPRGTESGITPPGRPATTSWPASSPSRSTASEQQSTRPVTWAGRRSMAALEQSWPPVSQDDRALSPHM
jgi:hypothetical protein